MRKRTIAATDEGLEQIADFERVIILGRVQLLEWNGVPADEVERERPAVVALAKAVTDRMREEYAARTRQP